MIYAIISIFILIIFLIIIFTKKKSTPVNKGELGESIVTNILGKTENGNQYIINDLLFENESGKSCQIDHIYINKFGIWVIETKNYSGTIYGQENQREWTQVLSHGNKINKFYNPIKQNTTHIYNLSKYLEVKNIFHNVVVFLSNADISNIDYPSVYSTNKLTTIKSNNNSNTLLSVDKMEYYYNKLLQLQCNPTISKEEHINNIHNMQNQIKHGICPRCGGKLVLRTGKNGQFYGCSNFPKCKFTKNID